MIKETMTYYEMDIPSSNADQLYWQEVHTIVESSEFDESDETYHIKGYKQT
ncbi:GTPase [Staphylococcus aureus]|nr:GTPase [Staphylococcus aureus]